MEIGQLEDLTPVKTKNKKSLFQRITVNVDAKMEEDPCKGA